MSDRIALGVIRKSHGVRGEASIEPWTDSLERFDDLQSVTLVSPDESQTREARVESVRAHAGRVLVKFSGVDSPEAVQLLHNWTLEIPESEARALEADEYFLHDLVGLTLIDADGNERGVVTEVYEGGGGILLNVKRGDGKTYELPFAADLCTEIDVPGKRMVVSLPEGLDDLEAVED
ncbi:MAG TPA: ribosome maturation factor RimM [Thermoanaerobaculia bacterium]|jgi:16S rRNA processing protein RimM